MSNPRKHYYEVWSRTPEGEATRHGAAFGATFQDACKQLACDSLDFWQQYARGTYAGRNLYETEREALDAG